MVEERAKIAVRDHDQRQVLAEHRATLSAANLQRSEVDGSRRLGAGIPHGALERRLVAIGSDLDQAKPGRVHVGGEQACDQGDQESD
jgi:hypothetical protein